MRWDHGATLAAYLQLLGLLVVVRSPLAGPSIRVSSLRYCHDKKPQITIVNRGCSEPISGPNEPSFYASAKLLSSLNAALTSLISVFLLSDNSRIEVFPRQFKAGCPLSSLSIDRTRTLQQPP